MPALAFFAALAFVLPLVGAVAASAQESPESTVAMSAAAAPPDDAPDSGKESAPPSESVTPSPPPTGLSVTSPMAGSLVQSSAVTVSGTGATPNKQVVVEREQNGSEPCATTADSNGGFACELDVFSGRDITVHVKDLDSEATESVTFNVLTAPTIRHDGPLFTNGQLSGTGFPTADITVNAGPDTACSVTVQPSGDWFCTLSGADGRYAAIVTQKTDWGRASSAPVTVVLDTVAPKKPTISAPSADEQLPLSGARFSGASAEDGVTVRVFNGSQTLCSAVAANGKWACVAEAVANAGRYSIVAAAWDRANNPSGDSPAVSYQFGAVSASPTETSGEPDPTRTDRETEPGSESPEKNGPDDASPDDETHSSTPPPAAAPPPGPGAPGPWEHATPFTQALPAVLGAEAVSGWLRALALAVITVLLILVPARLLAGTITGRRAAASALAFTGRNRSKSEFDTGFSLGVPGRAAMIAVGIVAAGALTIFANPVDGRPAYLRVLLAACIAVFIVNAVAAWLPRILVHAWQAGFAEVRFNPRWLLMVGGAVLVSRVFELHPALLFALVTTVRVPSVLSDTVRARLALSRMAGVFTVGVIAWLFAAFVPHGGGFFTQLLAETSNITALVGIGSAAIMMVPLGRLSGRAIFAWSRPLWTASVLAILTALFVMLGPTIADWRATGNVLAALALTLAFAALGFSVWLWKRYVQPRLTF